MEKLLRRVVSILCAITMVFTGLAFTPSKVSASGTPVPSATETKVGAWGLFAANEAWAGNAKMSYESSGSQLGQTKMYIDNSPFGNYNTVSYGMYARLAKYLSSKALTPDETYKIKITADINYNGEGEWLDPDAGSNYRNGKNVLIVNIQGTEFKLKVKNPGQNVEITTDETFDYDALMKTYGEGANMKDADDVYIYLAGLNTGTDITIKSVDFVVDNNGWVPVPNQDPAGATEYTNVGALSLLAMRNPDLGHYGQLKTKKIVETETGKISDYAVKVKNPGWTDYSKTGEGRSSWSASIRLKNYCADYGLVEGEPYTGVLKVRTNQLTDTDRKGRPKTLMVVVDGTMYEAPLTSTTELNEIPITEFEYSGENPDIDIDLDGLEAGTEIVLESFEFTRNSTIDWTPLPNETPQDFGRYELFARFATGIGDDNGQWGKLSYAKAPGVAGEPEKLEDTLIKVRSASGWYNAWATLATIHDYINTDPNKLEVGQAYKAKVTYYSNKATIRDSKNRMKELMLSVDAQPLTIPLEKCEDSDTFDTYKTAETDTFVFEGEQSENDPTAVVLNMDCLEKGTILRIKDIEFIPVTDYEWTPVRNDKFKTLGSTNMQLYARFDDKGTTGSWGKASYKFDTNQTSDFSDVTVLNRSTSGWYVENDPANVIDFIDVDQKYGLHKGWTYTGKIVFEDEVTDPTALSKGTKNEIAISMDGADLDHSKIVKLNGNKQETVVNLDEFVYKENSHDLRIIMDMMTKGSTLKVKSIEFTHKEGEPEYIHMNSGEPVSTGPWVLYSLNNHSTRTYGEMLYANETGDGSMGDTEIYCFGVSGWLNPAQGMLATLTDGSKKCEAGKNYSVAITIYSSEDNYGKNPDSADGKFVTRVNINDQNYDLDIYKGTHTYVIPSLKANYDKTASEDVIFDFDSVKAGSKFKISDIKFNDEPIVSPVEITELNVAVSGSSAKVTWEQTPNTYYGTIDQIGAFKVYVDEKEVAQVANNVREYTVSNLSSGPHKVAVKAVLGAFVSTGKVTNFVIDKPTEAPTQAPTQKPTVTPVTSKAPVVAKPGKATVKKAVKKKKSAKKIKVTLKKVAGATKYQVAVYKTKKNAKKNKKALVKKTVTKLTVTIKSKKLKGKKTVYVRARAWNVAGYGAWSGVKKSKKK